MNTHTLYSSHAPVEKYLRLISSSQTVGLKPTFTLSAVDCFALTKLLDAFPNKPTVIDGIAGPTAGASSVLLLQHPNVSRVASASFREDTPLELGLESLIAHSTEGEADLKKRLTFLGDPFVDPQQWEQLLLDINPLSPVVFLLNADKDVQQFVTQLRFLLSLHGSPPILLTSVGFLGKNTPLQKIVLECRSNQYREIVLLREVTPFFARSEFALLCRENDRYLLEILNRMTELFSGNFDFLTLLDDKLSGDRRILELEQKLQDIETMMHLQKAEPQAVPAPDITPTPPFPSPILQPEMPGNSNLRTLYRRYVPNRIRGKMRSILNALFIH